VCRVALALGKYPHEIARDLDQFELELIAAALEIESEAHRT
jgi:hypothetical protein